MKCQRCDHDLDRHSSSLRCKDCQQECGLDCTRMIREQRGQRAQIDGSGAGGDE